MKRTITILVLMLSFAVTTAVAQEGGTGAPGTRVNVGTGLWSKSPVIMPAHAGMEFGIAEEIAVGFDIEWRLFNDGWSHSIFVFQARGDYYFNNLIGITDTWDVYAGLQAGAGIITAPNGYPGTNKGFNFALDGYVGGRWYFSDSMALNAEVGLMGVFPDIVGPTPFMTFGITFGL